MKKLISVLLILLISLGMLSSCGDREYDEAEVKSAAKELIESSKILNEIYWGKGIPYIEDMNTSDGVYHRAVDSYHYLIGFKTIDELKTLTEKTFSQDFCKTHIYSTPVLAIDSNTEEIRYYQKYSAFDQTPEYIMVNSIWKPLISGEVAYDYDSLTVVGSEKETVYVTLKATVTLDNLEPQTREIRVALIEEESGWRIDSPTYLNYVKSN